MITGVSIDGRLLRALREKRRLTRKQLAERAQVNRGVLGRAETTRGYSTSLLYTWRLAEALGVPVADLVIVERGEQATEPMQVAS